MMINRELTRAAIFGLPMLFMIWLGLNEFLFSYDRFLDNIETIFGFYACVFVLFFAGAYMEGPVNRHLAFCFGLLLILNYVIYYGLYDLLPGSSYISVSLGVLGAAPGYLFYVYRSYIYARIGSHLPCLRKCLPIRATNVGFLFIIYYQVSMLNEAFYMVGMWALALYHEVPADGYLSDMMSVSDMVLPNVRDGFQALIDFIFCILLIIRCISDRKRPDAIGMGKTLSHR